MDFEDNAAPVAPLQSEGPSATTTADSGNGSGNMDVTSPPDGVVSEPAIAGQPRRKRRRIALACNPCRDRKMRCDGRRPICSGCEKRRKSHLCVYEASNFLKSSLEPHLEAQPEKVASISGSGEQRGVDLANLATAAAEPAQWTVFARASDDGSNATLGGNPLETPLSYERLPADSLIVVPNGKGLSTYGGSSAIALTTSVVQTLNSMPNSSEPPRLLFLVDDKTLSQQRLRRQPHDACGAHPAFALPTRSAADRYVKAFFEFVHPIFPILHRPSFYQRYYRIWTGETDDDGNNDHMAQESSIFLATTHMTFALGCLYCDTHAHEGKPSLASQFYQSSRKVFSFDAVDSISFDTIQLLLLQAVYLQSTAYANRCWNIVGMAIRGAQSIGLHVDSAEGARNDQLRREMRRRVWHACIIFDRLLALIFNRPVMIESTRDCPLPQAIDDEYLLSTAEGCQPVGQEPRMLLFIHSIKLWNILHDVLSTFYSGKQSACFVGRVEVHGWSASWLNDLFQLEQSLQELEDSLPECLKLSTLQKPDADLEDWVRLQIYVFQSRFLYIRALLLRPVLLVASHHCGELNISNSSRTPSLQIDVMIRICAHCISTVTTLVDLKYRGLQDLYSGPPWNTVHYIFVAAIAIAAAQLCPIADPSFQRSALKEVWDQCVVILEHYKPQVEAASTALHILCILGKRIESLQETLETGANDLRTQPRQSQKYSFHGPALTDDSILEGASLLSNPEVQESFDEPFNDAWLSMEMTNLDWFDLEL